MGGRKDLLIFSKDGITKPMYGLFSEWAMVSPPHEWASLIKR